MYAIPILMYHNVDDRWRESKLSVSPSSFDRQVSFILRKKNKIVPLIDVALNRKELGKKKRSDEWLKKILSLPPYEYEWGVIKSAYDSRSAFSSIVIRYNL